MAYLIIVEDELEDTVKLVGTKDYVYKFLFDSSNKDDYHVGKLGLTKLKDSLIFSDQAVSLRKLKYKKEGKDITAYTSQVINALFESGNYISIINDSYVHDNIVFVLTKATDDSDKALYLSNDAIDEVKKLFIENMMVREGLHIYTYDIFASGMEINEKSDKEYFKIVQRKLSDNEDIKLKEELLTQFNDTFKYKAMSIYSRMRYYDTQEIMDTLNNLGYLDERFDDCIIDEEEARRLLAKRLTVISLKKDIKLLIDKGIFKENSIQYDV